MLSHWEDQLACYLLCYSGWNICHIDFFFPFGYLRLAEDSAKQQMTHKRFEETIIHKYCEELCNPS
ncbi:hypothetical protein BVRB_3g059160 [Beta vulgaris subsp. vulgaris]|nr:hypothetical protein BVRB_3g059160 [Beta vulgaris subsp. vulgaris]